MVLRTSSVERALLLLSCLMGAHARNPLVPHTGMADPHVRYFGGSKVYMYSTHDQPLNISNISCCSGPWWIWSSEDLVRWERVSSFAGFSWNSSEYLHTNHLYWATDALEMDGRYYWYVSIGGRNIAVLRGGTPHGPWEDALGEVLFSNGASLPTPSNFRDPGTLIDDDGKRYVIMGSCFGPVQPDDGCYYLAEMNEDMISYKRLDHVSVRNAMGPWGPNKTDDKPFIHRARDIYYLSWGCWYAMSSSPWGPFDYAGKFMDIDLIEPEFRMNSTATPWYKNENYVDRHGSFLHFHGQWYFFCNDRSHSDALKFKQSGFNFRDTVAGYVHYRNNGSIAPIVIDAQGVGAHSFDGYPQLPAENYFSIERAEKSEGWDGGFEVIGLRQGSALVFGNVRGLASGGVLSLRVSNGGHCVGEISAHIDVGFQRSLFTRCIVEPTGSWKTYTDVRCSPGAAFADASSPVTLTLTFAGGCHGEEFARLDHLEFVLVDTWV